MRTLLVVDDLAELIPSKNPWVKRGLSWYLRYLETVIRQEGLTGAGPHCVAGPREITDALRADCEKLPYDTWFDSVHHPDAGELSRQIVEGVEHCGTLRRLLPEWFDSPISVPKIASIRLNFAFCYNPMIYYFMIKNMIKHHRIERIAVCGTYSEIERIALAVAIQEKLEVRQICPHDIVMKCKSFFLNYVYYRDRKLHLNQSLCAIGAPPERKQQIRDLPVVCMAPAHSVHFRILTPLAKALNRSNRYRACVLLQDAFRSHADTLRQEGIDYRPMDDLDYEQLTKVKNQNLWILKQLWKVLKTDSEFRAAFVTHGIDWFQILENKIEWFFKFSFPEISLLRLRIQKAFERLKPEAVFTFSDSRFFENTAASVARQSRIPTFLYTPNFLFDTDGINLYDMGDHLLVNGASMRDYVLSQGRLKPDQVTIVGDVRFDGADEWKRGEVQRQTRTALGIPPENRVLTLISFYTHMGITVQDKRAFFQIIRDAMKPLKNVSLVIKAHPNENEEVLHRFLKEVGMDHMPMTKSMPLYALFGITKGIINLTSLSSFEAMAFDVPVVTVTVPNRDYEYCLPLRSGGIASAGDPSSLTQILSGLLDDPGYYQRQIEIGRSFIQRYVYQNQTPAADRILSVLDRLAVQKASLSGRS